MAVGGPGWGHASSLAHRITRVSHLHGIHIKNSLLRNSLRVGFGLALGGSVAGLSQQHQSLWKGQTRRTTGSSRRTKTSSHDSKSNIITVSQGLLGINILMYGIQMATKDAIALWGAKVNELIVAGQYWRLITPAFFHGNLMHLIVNSYSLYNIAPALEGLCGGKRLLVTYIAAAVAGNVASFYGSTAPSLGASGAVFGLGGALAMYFYQNKKFYGKRSDIVLKQLWQTLVLNVLYGFANPRIDNWGHFGGLIGGAAIALLLGPKLRVAKGREGATYLVDSPPIRLLASPPALISR